MIAKTMTGNGNVAPTKQKQKQKQKKEKKWVKPHHKPFFFLNTQNQIKSLTLNNAMVRPNIQQKA